MKSRTGCEPRATMQERTGAFKYMAGVLDDGHRQQSTLGHSISEAAAQLVDYYAGM